jgi:outer membrane protein OmpA-like peptidoglycan-associated protein
MSKKIIINCDEATQICDKSQYCEASTFDKIKLSIHNFLCKKCHLYSEQNKIITKLFKVHIHPNKEKLKPEEKEKLKQILEKNIDD